MERAAKKVYVPPELVVHGRVDEITGFGLDDLGLPDPERVFQQGSAPQVGNS
jgi:hypothetical protein